MIKFSARFRANARAKHSHDFQLALEILEPRLMLSTVQIIAAGDEGGETMSLQIDGVTQQSWNAGTTVSTFPFNTSQTLTADQIRVAASGMDLRRGERHQLENQWLSKLARSLNILCQWPNGNFRDSRAEPRPDRNQRDYSRRSLHRNGLPGSVRGRFVL